MSVLDHWRLWANCYGMDPDLFYPERGDKLEPEVVAACATCPVRFPCLHSSMGEEFGTWGGWDREIRATVRRWARYCLQCGGEIPKADPVLFCSDDCLEGAVFSDDDNWARVTAGLDELDELASRYIRIRKPSAEVAA